MKKFFEAFGKFDKVSEDVKKRRETDGLTQQEMKELKEIEESPCVKEFKAYMEKKPPRVQVPLCKSCGKMICPIRAETRQCSMMP